MLMTGEDKSCLIILDLPIGALCGIDLLSFTTTPQYKGIRSIPSGLHLIFVSPSTELAIRHAAWFWADGKTNENPNVYVKKWDTASEVLLEETNDNVVSNLRSELPALWKANLTPYRQRTAANNADISSETGDWPVLTDSISRALLSRITGGSYNHWALTTAGSAARDMDDIPGLTREESRIQPERELHFLPIDLKRTWRPGATGRERTDAARDLTWALNDIISTHCAGSDEMEVIGEMQFTFLMVLTLNNYSCLEQWKRILNLLFLSQQAIVQRPRLYEKALPLLKLQLQHCSDVDGGLFDLSDEEGSLLKSLLKRFRKNIEMLAGEAKSDLLEEDLEEVEEYLKAQHGWSFDNSYLRSGILELEDGEKVDMDVGGTDDDDYDDATGDYAPVVVELTEEQKEMVDHEPNTSTSSVDGDGLLGKGERRKILKKKKNRKALKK